MDKQKDLEEYVVKHKQEIDEMRNVCDGAFLVVELYDIVKLHKAGYRKEEQTRKETAREILSEVKERMFSYFDCVNEKTAKCNYKGETLMNYEVADMIDSIIENLVEKYGVEIKE